LILGNVNIVTPREEVLHWYNDG